uniref:Metalloendopeptidase n=1 Tax=Parastrongyloides trichosuri TaxID=131310 RepID=A0A0N4Z2X8_PARTI
MKGVFQLIFLFNLVDNLYCNDDSINVRIKRTMLKDMRHKWTFPIEYTTNYPVNLATVQKALNILQNETCITFTKVDSFTGPGLNYYYGSGCLSFIGKTSDTYPQDISLGWNCDHVAVVLHETAHALGVIHEMNRPDRDNYVFIYDKNMNPAQAFNFVRNPAN